MSGLQRYLRCARSGDMLPDSNGAWCKYDEAAAEIERLQERIREAAKLNMGLMEIRDDLDLDWDRLRSGDQRALIADHQDVFNMMFDLQAEIERLRGLLRDLLDSETLTNVWHVRVRDALSDE